MIEFMPLIFFTAGITWIVCDVIHNRKVEKEKRDIIRNGLDFEYVRYPTDDEIMVVTVDVGSMPVHKAEAYMKLLMEHHTFVNRETFSLQ